MGNYIPMKEGDKFGRLTINGKAKKGKHQEYLYPCICDCGETLDVNGSRLRKGIIWRCRIGCQIDTGLSIANCIYRELARRDRTGKKLNLKFLLSKEEVYTLFKGNCYYCKAPPSTTRKVSRLNGGEFVYNGIDRLDSNLPYQIGNVVSCCSKCNFMKHVLSLEQFKEHITLIYNNFVLDN